MQRKKDLSEYDRCRLIQDLVDEKGKCITLYPMRFQPYTALKKNTYINKHWSEKMLINLNRILQTQIGFLHVYRTKQGESSIDRILGSTYEKFMEGLEIARWENKKLHHTKSEQVLRNEKILDFLFGVKKST